MHSGEYFLKSVSDHEVRYGDLHNFLVPNVFVAMLGILI